MRARAATSLLVWERMETTCRGAAREPTLQRRTRSLPYMDRQIALRCPVYATAALMARKSICLTRTRPGLTGALLADSGTTSYQTLYTGKAEAKSRRPTRPQRRIAARTRWCCGCCNSDGQRRPQPAACRGLATAARPIIGLVRTGFECRGRMD